MTAESPRFFIVLAACLGFVAACAQNPPQGLSDADRAALRALTDTQVRSGRAGDWATFVQTLTSDVVRMPPDQASVQGRDVVASWQKTFPPIKELTNYIDAIDGSADFAYMRGHNQITLEVQGKPMTLSFKWLGVYRKGPDGTWKMQGDMWNTNPAPAK